MLELSEEDNLSPGEPRELQYHFNERQVGFIGNNATSGPAYGDVIAEHQSQSGSGPFRNGSTQVIPLVDFGQSYVPVNGLDVPSSAGTYYLHHGDTLQPIAQAAGAPRSGTSSPIPTACPRRDAAGGANAHHPSKSRTSTTAPPRSGLRTKRGPRRPQSHRTETG